jgi:ABC-type oligopeptide transport system substrate-binding subunit
MTLKSVFRCIAAALLSLQAALAQAPTVEPKKVLRVALRSAETGFDPAMISDLYSRTITPPIFEALYGYDHLARAAKVKPLTAVGARGVGRLSHLDHPYRARYLFR